MKRMLFLTALFVGFGLAISYQPAQAAGCTPDNIIFSEIDYDGQDPENNFLELYLPNAATINDCEIRLVNGAGGSPAVYRTATISGTYAAGTYLCLGEDAGDSISWNTSSCPDGTNCIQDGQNGSTASTPGTGGDPDGFALVDTSDASLSWFYSYEGTISGYDPGDGSSNTSTDLGAWDYSTANPNISLINPDTSGVGDVTTTTHVTRCAANEDDSGSPTAIALASLTASSPSPLGFVALLGVVLSSGAWVVLRRKKH